MPSDPCPVLRTRNGDLLISAAMSDYISWISEGWLPREIDDKLAIVKAKTRLLLDFVTKFVDPSYFYFAEKQHRNGAGSRWKAGYVGDRQHISIQTGLYPTNFDSKESFYLFIDTLVGNAWPLDDLVVDEAVAWDPPPGCVANGDLDYRCVVLKLKKSPKIQDLRNRIRANIPGFDRFGAEANFHITVAYICDPENNVERTQAVANELVRELNARFRGATVPLDLPRPDDNGFDLYGSSAPLSDFVSLEKKARTANP